MNIDLSKSLFGPLNTLSQIAFTPLSDHLLFGSVHGDFGVSQIETGNSLLLHNLGESISHVKVPDDGVICALMGSNQLSVYDLVKQSPFFSHSQNDVTCLDFAPTAGTLILGDQTGNLNFLDLRQKAVASQIKASDFGVGQMSIHPFNDLLMVGDSQGVLKVCSIFFVILDF